jgi:hypothetical protein
MPGMHAIEITDGQHCPCSDFLKVRFCSYNPHLTYTCLVHPAIIESLLLLVHQFTCLCLILQRLSKPMDSYLHSPLESKKIENLFAT